MPQFQAVTFSKGKKDELASWLTHELTNCIGDRGTLEQKWRSELIQWKSRTIGDGVCDVPYVGASDIEMPLTPIHSDPVFADFMQSLHAPKDFWSITGIRPDGVAQAKPLQEFLSLVEKRDIKMRRVNKRALLDVVVHGTGIYKDYILHDRKKRRGYQQDGSIGDVISLKYQPAVDHIPLQDFFIPAYAWNIDPDDIGGAPWVAQRFRLTLGEFKARKDSASPYLPAYDKKAAEAVEAWQTSVQGADTVQDAIRQEDQYTPWRDDKITLYEIWARFDVDGDGVQEDIVLHWHHEARAILRATFIPLVHGKRPFEAPQYLPGFGFYGMGIAEIDRWAQLAISRLLNETINNASLANTVMLSGPLGMNFNAEEPLYAGRFFPTGSGEKVSAINMGQPYPGMFQIINDLSQWAEQRTAVTELRQGSIDGLPSRTPASTVMQLLGEGNKRFDMIMSNLRENHLSAIGQRQLQNLIQISKDDPRYIALALQALGQEDGSKVAAVLQGDPSDIESNFGVGVSATSSKVNKEIDKQNLIQLAQYMAQGKPQQLQYAQALVQMKAAPPQLLLEVLQAGLNSSIEFERRLLEAYDVQNPEQYSPAPVVAQAPAAPAPMAGGQPAPGGAPAALPMGGPQGAAPLAQGDQALLALLGLG